MECYFFSLGFHIYFPVIDNRLLHANCSKYTKFRWHTVRCPMSMNEFVVSFSGANHSLKEAFKQKNFSVNRRFHLFFLLLPYDGHFAFFKIICSAAFNGNQGDFCVCRIFIQSVVNTFTRPELFAWFSLPFFLSVFVSQHVFLWTSRSFGGSILKMRHPRPLKPLMPSTERKVLFSFLFTLYERTRRSALLCFKFDVRETFKSYYFGFHFER